MNRQPFIWKYFVGFLVLISCTTLVLVTWCSVGMENSQSVLVSTSHLSYKNSQVLGGDQLILKHKTEESDKLKLFNVEQKRHQEVVSLSTLAASINNNYLTVEAAADSVSESLTEDKFMQDSLLELTGAVPVPLNNEFEVAPFTRFTIDRIYPVEPGLGRRVIEKPIGYRKREILLVIDRAVAHLNQKNLTAKQFTSSDFIEGIYRMVPSAGTHYELFFREGTRYRRIVIALPFAQAAVVETNSIATRKDPIHLVLPLSGRVDAFRNFMKRYERLLVNDNGLSLTVVYFGTEGLSEVQSIVANFTIRHHLSNTKLISAKGTFSRSKGLQVGIDSLDKGSGDPLLFLCDVDVAFTVGFLERCRLHSVKRRSVYYPIVFSLYNPAVLLALNGTGPSADQPIGRESGFWRDFGYGMTCQYRSDFYRIGGFTVDNEEEQLSANGWGMEDVRLYRRHLLSGHVTVIRATDPGIFHIWHEKRCDSNLPSSQYTGCLRSKALSEASQAQLGMLLFKKNFSKSPSKISKSLR